jgi:hypothetical protein
MHKYHYEDCQFLYKKMLFTLDQPINNARDYAYNLKETEYCDYIKDFKTIRKEYDSYQDDIKEINMMNNVPSNNDNITKHTLLHYRTWHRINILDALSYKNRFNYHYGNFTNQLYQIYRNIFK